MKLFKLKNKTYGIINNSFKELITHYNNGNYAVYLFIDGTKVRETEDDVFIPQFSENVDVCLTKKCSQGCVFCYEGCTTNGKHGKIDYKFLDNLHSGTEIALNGNDMDHPQLDELLYKLKNQQIITNITVNKNQFISHYEHLKDYQSKHLLYGIGISTNEFDEDFISKVSSIDNAVIHTIAGICPIEEYKKLYNRNLKILILGYKTTGRGISYFNNKASEITQNIVELNKLLPELANNISVLSFDNLAISQLSNVKTCVGDDWETFYMGDDGSFTFYIDLVNGEFAKNSCIQERFPIEDKTIDDMFNFIRNNYEK